MNCRRFCFWRRQSVFIFPIAIAYNMGQIIKSVCLCQCMCPSVCLSVCLSALSPSHSRISSSIFAKNGTEVTTPKVRTSSLGVNIAPFFPLFFPKTAILGREYAFSSLTRTILKLAYYRNYCNDCNQILHSDKDHQMPFVGGLNTVSYTHLTLPTILRV